MLCVKKILPKISEFIICIILHVGDWHYVKALGDKQQMDNLVFNYEVSVYWR